MPTLKHSSLSSDAMHEDACERDFESVCQDSALRTCFHLCYPILNFRICWGKGGMDRVCLVWNVLAGDWIFEHYQRLQGFEYEVECNRRREGTS